MPKFQIVTTNGDSYVDGESHRFEPFETVETLQEFAYDGDYIELRYSGGIKISIPEAQIAYIVTT